MIKCGKPKHLWRENCTPEMECYIKSPEHYNCFCVYAALIHETEHTLQEVAKLMNISHTTVKQIEAQALEKIRNSIKSGDITLEQAQTILKGGEVN